MTSVANTELAFSEEQAMIMESARGFCRERSGIPAVRQLLHSAHAPNHSGFDPEVWSDLVDLGWLGVTIPQALGGYEFGIGTGVCIAEAMGRYLLATPFISTTLVAQALIRGGLVEQQQTWLPKIARGTIATLALLENEDWGDPQIRTTVRAENDKLILNGTKRFVCDAVSAELFIVSARLVNEDGSEQTVLLIVRAHELTADAIKPQLLIDETKRSAVVDFDQITLERTALMDPARAQATLRDVYLLGAMLTAAEATGSAAAALDCTVNYLKTRKQFGKLIGSYQALKHPTVDILNAMESARSLVYHAATLTGDEVLSSDAEIACRMAKAQATDALLNAGDRAIQFHGAMGFTYECDAQLYLRRAQWSQQQFGDAMHHRKRLAPLLLDEPNKLTPEQNN